MCATEEDLAETAKQVEALDRRIFAAQADVRDYGALKAAFDDGRRRARAGSTSSSANAGVCPRRRLAGELDEDEWQDMLNVNLTGVWHTVKAAMPHLIARRARRVDRDDQLRRRPPGHAQLRPLRGGQARPRRLMRSLALELAPHSSGSTRIHPPRRHRR